MSSVSLPVKAKQHIPEKTCGLCESTTGTLKVCSGCKTVHYCSKEHQESDWKAHKAFCRQVTDLTGLKTVLKDLLQKGDTESCRVTLNFKGTKISPTFTDKEQALLQKHLDREKAKIQAFVKEKAQFIKDLMWFAIHFQGKPGKTGDGQSYFVPYDTNSSRYLSLTEQSLLKGPENKAYRKIQRFFYGNKQALATLIEFAKIKQRRYLLAKEGGKLAGELEKATKAENHDQILSVHKIMLGKIKEIKDVEAEYEKKLELLGKIPFERLGANLSPVRDLHSPAEHSETDHKS